MGHTQVPAKNDPLYGFKGDLKEQLADRNLPTWIKQSPIHVISRQRDISVTEAFEQAAEEARKSRQRLKEQDRDRDLSGVTYPIQFELSRGKPGAISDKLNITREDARQHTGIHRVNPRGYRLVVSVGVQGGINDLEIVRDFHH